MTFHQEWNSWKSPKALETSPMPELGSKAPSCPKLQFPSPSGKPAVVSFLRHCGCPFAEKTFLELRKVAGKNPDLKCIAVSHSSEEATEKWIIAVGGEWDVSVIVDADRELYAKWGLGTGSAWHVLNPWSMYSVYRLGKNEKIWNRPTESGNRWQTSGSFAVDRDGIVRWAKVAKSADDIPDFQEALNSLGLGS